LGDELHGGIIKVNRAKGGRNAESGCVMRSGLWG
jgi:hypothetical protein